MGCTGSQIQARSSSILLTNKKPSVWLIGGGPGSQKGIICENLVRDYKFKYLSSYDMVQFQQQRGGADAQQINKLIKQNKTIPSNLIVRLIKKAIASCGVRRYLIDGFPNSPQDVLQFDKQLTAQYIDFYGYLYIQIPEQKMIQSGIQAHTPDPKLNPNANTQIHQTVKQIVKTYLTTHQKIKQQYLQNNKYHQIQSQKTIKQTYEQLKSYFKKFGIKIPQPVKVLLCHFDNQEYQFGVCNNLVRKYGLHYYQLRGLVQEAANKVVSQEDIQIRNYVKENKDIPANLILFLIKKKIQKHDYTANYLISGFPRNKADAQEWDKSFNSEARVLSYIAFQASEQNFKKSFSQNLSKSKLAIKPQQITKKFTKYQQDLKQLSNYYKQQQKYLSLNYDNKQNVSNNLYMYFQIKKFIPKTRMPNKKIVFISNICGNGQVCIQVAKKRGVDVFNVDGLLDQKMKQNGLYSQLIQSYIRINKPVSGLVISRILMQQITQSPKNLIIINGFPNSQQQLQTWQQQIGNVLQISLIIIHSQNHKYIEQTLRDKIKNKIVIGNQKDVIEISKQNSNRISQRLKQSDWNVYTFSSLSDGKEVQEVFDKYGFK